MRIWHPVTVALVVLGLGCVAEQPTTDVLVIPVGDLGSSPVPTLLQGKVANRDPADLMFLRLAELPPTLVTSGDDGFVPRLARSWERRDSVTLVFHLDQRARWSDGVPVTARDVVFAFGRARDPAIAPSLSSVLTSITDVVAEDDRTVAIKFGRAFAEQLYTATFHVHPLPAHLLESIDPDSLISSAFVRAPVGDGPYRFAELIPGQRLILTANEDFFLGRPAIDRVVFQLVPDADARLNLLLSGEAGALQAISPRDVPRVEADSALEVIVIPTFGLGYLLFNQRDPRHLDRPHPILADVRVRRAIIQALDRRKMLDAVYHGYADVPQGPVARLHWIRDTTDLALPYDPGATRRLLEEAGWHRTPTGWARNGKALRLTLNYPTTSRSRSQFAQLIQEQLRQAGIDLRLNGLDGAIWFDRRKQSDFDIDFSSAAMDPSPSGLQQSWSCAGLGGSNVGHYCNPSVDSLLTRAIYAQENTLPVWRELLATIRRDAPAAFIYSPNVIFGVSRRYTDVDLVPYSYWSHVWRWRLSDRPVGPAPVSPGSSP